MALDRLDARLGQLSDETVFYVATSLPARVDRQGKDNSVPGYRRLLKMGSVEIAAGIELERREQSHRVAVISLINKRISQLS